MPIEGGLKFEFADGRPPEEARFWLDDSDALTLRRFLAETEEMRQTIERQGGFGATFSASLQNGEPLLITGTEPSADQRAAVMHRLRPFLLQNEPLNFHVVRCSIARSPDSDCLRGVLKGEKIGLKENCFSGGYGFRSSRSS